MMLDSHAAALLALTGLCHGHPGCRTPATVRDDSDPNVLRCPAHAREVLVAA